MSEYPNSGIIRKNDYKKAGSKAPDATGNAKVTCPKCLEETEFVIAAWIREGRKGRFTTLKFTDKAEDDRRKAEARAKREGGSASAPASAPVDDAPPVEDDIPF